MIPSKSSPGEKNEGRIAESYDYSEVENLYEFEGFERHINFLFHGIKDALLRMDLTNFEVNNPIG